MSSHAAMSPTGGADNMRRVMEDRSLDLVSVEYVVSRENMRRAWKQVKANGGVPGVDDITIEEFPTYAKANWEGIKSSLLL
jgi:RNA-directed DNA polymerase